MSDVRPFVVALLATALIGPWMGYTYADNHGKAEDLSKEEAFHFGWTMAECSTEGPFTPLANMTADCQESILAFCREHPKTYGDECEVA